MFAVVSFGGKQYKLEPNFVSEMGKVDGNVGDEVKFNSVIFVVNDDNSVVDGKNVLVSGVIARHFKKSKIRVYKKRQRTSGFEKTQGHRQCATGVLIKEIKFS